MGDLPNINEFKKQADAQQKKFNKSELANIILNAPPVDIIPTELKHYVENLSKKDFSKESAETNGNVAKLVVELRSVQNVNIDLKRRLNELELHSRINNIEVQGIEAGDDEKAVLDLLSSINSKVCGEDIDACHKVPTRSDRLKPIIVRIGRGK